MEDSTLQQQWQWLAELLDHAQTKLHRNQIVDEQEIFRSTAIDHAMVELGMPAELVIEGLAYVCSLSPSELRWPTIDSFKRCHMGRISRALPAFGEVEDSILFGICKRWLSFPQMIYAIDPNRICRWLLDSSSLVSGLKRRLRREGLAILGPDRLKILAQYHRNQTGDSIVREIAQSWQDRCVSCIVEAKRVPITNI